MDFSSEKDTKTYKFYSDQATKNSIWSSTWNGLMLEYDKTSYKSVNCRVRNVLTGQTFRLPPFPHVLYYPRLCGIGYDATSMRYKVVVSFSELGSEHEYECGIFTVGVDKSWRIVCTDHLSFMSKNTLGGFPIITDGFVHWNGFGDSHVVTLNLETEIIAKKDPPISNFKTNTAYCCFSTGRYLSFFVRCGHLVWEALEMKPETEEWRKLTNICLEGKKEKLKRLGFRHDDFDIMPCGWLKYPEVLAFRIRRSFIVFYNLITCEIGAEKLSTCFYSCVTPYKNSLVSF